MKQRYDQSGVAHLVAILAVVMVVAIGVVGWKVWDNVKDKSGNNSSSTSKDDKKDITTPISTQIKKTNKSIRVISKYCKETRDSSVSDEDIKGSKQVLIDAGFSKGYIDSNFWASSVRSIDGSQVIEWHYCVENYSGSLVVIKTANREFKPLDTNKKDHTQLISVNEAIKIMQNCGGMIEENYNPDSLELDYTLSTQFGKTPQDYTDPPEEKFNTSFTLVSIKEKRSQFHNTRVFVDLSNGSCYQAEYIGPV